MSNLLKLSLTGTLASSLLIFPFSPARAAAGSAHTGTSRHTSPRALVLTMSNLPGGKGWHEAGQVQPNRTVAVAERLSLATVNHYRITGYGVSFFRTSPGRGLVSIADSVGLYKSRSAAKWQYRQFTSLNRKPRSSKKLTVTGIGDQARGWSASTPRFGVANIYFRRGIFTARLDATSLGPMNTSELLYLARLLDQRMKKAH